MNNDNQEMAWNDPGKNNQDPWGGKQGGINTEIPPELQKIINNLKDKFKGLFGGSNNGSSGKFSGITAILVFILVVWSLSGIYLVEPAERGVVLRFGHHVETTFSGPHWHLPYPIESVEIVDVETVRDITIGYRDAALGRNVSRGTASVLSEALMLTKDENIIKSKFAVQYRIKNAEDYLFNVAHPIFTLRQVTESAIREVVGKNTMDFALTEGRAELVAQIEKLVQQIMDKYQSGILVTQLTMKDAQPPDQVQDAFADVVKAKEDNKKFINKAETYRNDIIPQARGKVSRIIAEANAYKEQIVAKALGETSRFKQILAEYKKSPKITKKRMYLETMQQVLSNTGKVLVDTKNANSIIMLPAEKMFDTQMMKKLASQTAAKEEIKKQRNINTSRNRGGR